MGASQHPFPKLHSHPPLGFIQILAYHTDVHTEHRTLSTSVSLFLLGTLSLSHFSHKPPLSVTERGVKIP